MFEIVDSRPLAQKFGVRYDNDFGVRPLLVDETFDLIAGADGHGWSSAAAISRVAS
jgi:hypothetical protein